MFLGFILFIVSKVIKNNFKKQNIVDFLGIFLKDAKDTSFVVENGVSVCGV